VAAAIQSAQELMQQNAELVDWARKMGVPGAPPAGAWPAPGDAGGDRIERLERLAKLRESGTITDEEFQRLKDEILGA
jgi:Short C-terminal domain